MDDKLAKQVEELLLHSTDNESRIHANDHINDINTNEEDDITFITEIQWTLTPITTPPPIRIHMTTFLTFDKSNFTEHAQYNYMNTSIIEANTTTFIGRDFYI